MSLWPEGSLEIYTISGWARLWISFSVVLIINCTAAQLKHWSLFLQKIMILAIMRNQLWNNYQELLFTKWSIESWEWLHNVAKLDEICVFWGFFFLVFVINFLAQQFISSVKRVWMVKYNDIHWVRGPLLWWNPSWPGFQQRLLFMTGICWSKTYSDQKCLQRTSEKEALKLKALKMSMTGMVKDPGLNQSTARNKHGKSGEKFNLMLLLLFEGLDILQKFCQVACIIQKSVKKHCIVPHLCHLLHTSEYPWKDKTAETTAIQRQIILAHLILVSEELDSLWNRALWSNEAYF